MNNFKKYPLAERIFLVCFLIASTATFININFIHPRKANASELNNDKSSINFLVLSDWGRDGIDDKDKKTPGQLKVAKQLGKTAEEINASFLITCGDNFHGKGVPSVSDPLWKENFEDIYNAKSLMIPWYVTLGNHDNGGNVDAELEYAKTSQRWVQPGRYYSFNKKINGNTDALFVILDSSPFIEEYKKEDKDGHHIKGQNTEIQVKWCDSVLNASNAKWKFVIYHHPAYSASSKHGSSPEIQKIFVPMFEKYHVDACFSGHDHDLQHSHPDGSNVEYFGCGGGSEVRPAGKADFTKFSVSSLGFGVVSLTENKFKLSFVNETGKEIYKFEIKK